jgi:signal transduction histidine kinase
MKRNHLKRLEKNKLRWWLLWFFFALTIPTVVLVQQSYSRLKWETYHQHQVMADELTTRINGHFLRLINAEEQRPFTDYSFLNLAGVPTANFLQRSPLSKFPVASDIPGVIGYFQVDAAGKLMTPLLPDEIDKAVSLGIAKTELSARRILQDRIQQILGENRLVSKQNVAGGKQDESAKSTGAGRADAGLATAENDINPIVDKVVSKKNEAPTTSYAIEGQAAFDELRKTAPKKSIAENKLGRLEDLKLKQSYSPAVAEKNSVEKEQTVAAQMQKKMRTEQIALPEALPRAKDKSDKPAINASKPAAAPVPSDVNAARIRTFESTIDPFEFSQLDSGEFVLFRKVWLNDQRYIQGLLIEQDTFLQAIINTAFRETALSQMSDLLVVYRGDVLSAFSGRSSRGYLSSTQELNGELLYQARLSKPFSELQLLFSITQLPVGAGGWVVIWLSIVLATVFIAGFYLLYRLGVGQINLVNQQQDFISAVSHELKTPLTSIRMYGEMLQAGWVDESKLKSYYDFILDESERLSRLISNVLQLAGLTRNEKPPALIDLTVAELMDGIQSKVSTQIERAGFDLSLQGDDAAAQANLKVNADWFTQIMINLVDNAIKFSAKTEIKTIAVSCHRLSNGQIQFKVRDYGPGIAKDQMKKIFKLFYRSENELTRETAGTGIGLALTHHMVMGMKGQIDVINKNPGAEFRVTFPVS